MSDRYVELVTLADQAQAAGNLQRSEDLALEALRTRPSGVSARELLGILNFRQGRIDAAIQWLEEAETLDPESFLSPFWLSQAYRAQGEEQDSLNAARRAVDRDPSQYGGYHQLGLSYMQLQFYPEAEEAFRKAVALKSAQPMLLGNLGHSVYWQGRRIEAEEILDQVARLDLSGRVSFGLAEMFLSYLDYGLAQKYGEKTIERVPDLLGARLVLVRALFGAGQLSEAELQLQIALERLGENYELRNEYALLRESQDDSEDAKRQIEKSIKLQSRQGFAYYASLRIGGTASAEFIERVEAVLADPLLRGEHAPYLHFALGKANEDLGKFELAISHFDEANRTNAKFSPKTTWTPGKSAQRAAAAFKRFDERYFDQVKEFGSEDRLPIFVVGMMRSGTTLVEQILGSHPQIGAAGEQPFWLHVGLELKSDRLTGLTAEYLQILQRLCPGKSKVVDKMPNNYQQLGLIHAALPQAKIIHVRRHPVDTCISLWSTPKACPAEWGGQKSTIVSEYRLYRDYMAHWRRVIPAQNLLEIDYESLVSNQEAVTLRMIEFCGVAWDPACLTPERNRRHVTTPSLAQVRRPVYKSSVERWRKFEPWLGEFKELL